MYEELVRMKETSRFAIDPPSEEWPRSGHNKQSLLL